LWTFWLKISKVNRKGGDLELDLFPVKVLFESFLLAGLETEISFDISGFLLIEFIF